MRSAEVIHNGETVTIERNQNNKNTIAGRPDQMVSRRHAELARFKADDC